jgi:hypothetical protein
MTTSEPTLTTSLDQPDRVPLRITLSEVIAEGPLDGAWWPQSRDLQVEGADLIDHFPPGRGRIYRLGYSPPDWAAPLRRIRVARGVTKAGSFPKDDTHVVRLALSTRYVAHLLVVPPETTESDARALMDRAARASNLDDASTLLQGVAEHPTVDDQEIWSDAGGAYWDPHPVAPSHRP